MKICGHVSHPIEEERFRALIELSLDAIALVEPDGTVSRVSPSSFGFWAIRPRSSSSSKSSMPSIPTNGNRR